MNKEQEAALTDGERLALLAYSHQPKVAGDVDVESILTALADARLEIAALQGRATDSWRRKVVRLEAEVARLTEERDALNLVRELTSVEHGQDHEELDQQREDIQRLVEALRVIRPAHTRSEGICTFDCRACPIAALLAEMEGRYGA